MPSPEPDQFPISLELREAAVAVSKVPIAECGAHTIDARNEAVRRFRDIARTQYNVISNTSGFLAEVLRRIGMETPERISA